MNYLEYIKGLNYVNLNRFGRKQFNKLPFYAKKEYVKLLRDYEYCIEADIAQLRWMNSCCK